MGDTKSEIVAEGEKGRLTQHNMIMLGTVGIAKRIRTQLKVEFSGCKFSVTSEHFAGGSGIDISLMKADRKIIQDFADIPKDANNIIGRGYTAEDIKAMQSKRYHQLNHLITTQAYNPRYWNNGVFLTEQGHKLLQEVSRIASAYNYDNSDPMTDYFDVNFYLSINLGKWNADFEEGNE